MTNKIPTARDRAFAAYLRGSLTAETRGALDASGLSTAPGAPAAGSTGYNAGYMVPQAFSGMVATALKDASPILRLAEDLPTAIGAPMAYPQIDPTQVVGYSLSEANQMGFGVSGAGGTASVWAVSQLMLSGHAYLSGMIVASMQLVQDSPVLESWLAEVIGLSVSRRVSMDIYTGAGTNNSISSPVSALVSAGRIVQGTAGATVYQSGATSTNALAAGAVSYQDLNRLKYSVPASYRRAGANWICNDVTAQSLHSITDSAGRPIVKDHPDFPDGVLLGHPIEVDEYAPNLGTTAASASGALMFGCWSKGLVYRHTETRVSVERERWAEYLSLGYRGMCRLDIQVRDSKAISVFKTAAS
jgi:HK97 family phage major capsid protein